MSSKRSLIFVCDEFAVGGAEKYVAELALHLHPLNVSSHLLTISKPSNDRYLPNFSSIKTTSPTSSVPILKQLSKLIQLTRKLHQLSQLSPQTVIAYSDTRSFYYSLLWRVYHYIFSRNHLQHWYIFHSSDYLELKLEGRYNLINIFNKLKELFVYRSVDKVIAYSSFSQTTLQDYFKVPEKIIALIPPGSDPTMPVEPTSSSVLELVCVTRVAKKKGLYVLFESLKQLRASHTQFHLTVCLPTYQNFTEFTQLLQFHQQLELGSHITYIINPSPQKLQALYSQADLAIFPSLYHETFGFTILEALSTGTPVIAFAIGAPEELIAHNQTGYIVPEITTTALSQTIVEYTQLSPKEKFQLSQQASTTTRQYQWQKTAESFSQLMT